MVSKCANPACSERFLYLHQGKLFNLAPTLEIEEAGAGFVPALYERFWLCDQCCKRMTLVWGGTGVKLVPTPAAEVQKPELPIKKDDKVRARRRAASAGLHWR